jgi:hypothetical protein
MRNPLLFTGPQGGNMQGDALFGAENAILLSVDGPAASPDVKRLPE